MLSKITYDNEIYWQITETSAVRSHKGKLKILTIHEGGSIQCLIRSVQPSIYRVVEDQIRRSEQFEIVRIEQPI